MEKKWMKGKLVAGVAAMSLAACCMAAPAFADGNSQTTKVTLKTDPTNTQITWTVPTEIPFAAQADGTLVGPSADALKITNGSVFPIHVTNVAAMQASPFNLVTDVSQGSDANAVSFTMKTGSTTVDAATGMDTSKIADYNMGYAKSGTDTIALETAGKLARANVDLTTAQQAATVTFTAAPGNAK